MHFKSYLAFFLTLNLSLVCISSADSFSDKVADIPSGTLRYADTVIVIPNITVDKYEVTKEQFCKFLNSDSSIYLKADSFINISNRCCKIILENGQYKPLEKYKQHPVSCVTYEGAIAYAKNIGKRLPTYYEWLYIATDCKYVPGKDTSIFNADANIKSKADSDSWPGSSPVGSFEPNAFGIYDIFGNVAEYVASETSIFAYGGSFKSTHDSYFLRQKVSIARTRSSCFVGFRCIIDNSEK